MPARDSGSGDSSVLTRERSRGKVPSRFSWESCPREAPGSTAAAPSPAPPRPCPTVAGGCGSGKRLGARLLGVAAQVMRFQPGLPRGGGEAPLLGRMDPR